MVYKIKDLPKGFSIGHCNMTLIDWSTVDDNATAEEAMKKEVNIEVEFDDPCSTYFATMSVKDANGKPSKVSFAGDDLKRLGEFFNSFSNMMDIMRDRAIDESVKMKGLTDNEQ